MFSRRVKPWVLAGLGLAWLAGVLPLGAAGATPAEDEKLFRPLAAYQAKGRRDPFVQPQAGLAHSVLSRVDIAVLRLTGVIHRPQRSLALFATQSGPKFGYLLKNGRLYRENNQPVSGITGEILNRREVALKQGEDRIVFRLP